MLSSASLLDVWQLGRRLHSVDQALLVLSAAYPQRSSDELASLCVGHRDALLLSLHARLFGDRLEARAQCHHCGETVEFDLSCHALLGEGEAEAGQPRSLCIQGVELTVRAATSRDLAAAAAAGSSERARAVLFERCVHTVDGTALDAGSLADDERSAIDAALAAADPRAEVLLTLSCGACGDSWQKPFDIVSFLWVELSARAHRVLRDVDVLARVYGWSEPEILRLADDRRDLYVEMASS